MNDDIVGPHRHPPENAAIAPPQRSRRRWLLKRGAVLLAALFLIGVVGCLIAVKDYVRSLASLRRVPNTKMYVMDYYGDYNIAGLAANGIDANDAAGSLIRNFFPRFLVPLANWNSGHKVGERNWHTSAHSCSSVAFRTSRGDVYFGRNFDWMHDPCLVLRIHAPNGGSSVALLDPFYLQLDDAKLASISFRDRLRLLFAPYLVFDGMNDRGLAISSMAATDSRLPPFDPSKPTLLKPIMMRVLLDCAGTVPEAVELLRRYNIDFDGVPCHLMIADASGKSLVVEFVDGSIKTVPATRNWQVSTNHLLDGKSDSQNVAICPRYQRASQQLAAIGPEIDLDGMTQVMSAISVMDWTMWTSVYCLTTGEFRIAYRRDFENVYDDRLSSPAATFRPLATGAHASDRRLARIRLQPCEPFTIDPQHRKAACSIHQEAASLKVNGATALGMPAPR